MTTFAPRYYVSEEPRTRWLVRRRSRDEWEVIEEGSVSGIVRTVANDEFAATYWRERLDEITLGECTPSSQIARVGYDPATWDLVVEFKSGSGSRYHYRDVPPDIGAKLMHLPAKGEKWSLGSYFYQVIRAHPELYPYQKLDVARAGPVEAATIEEKIAASVPGVQAMLGEPREVAE